MNPKLIYSYKTEDGLEIFIEGENQTSKGNVNISGSSEDKNDQIKKVNTKFEKALGVIKASCNALKHVIDEVGPNEVTIEFNIKSKGEAGFFAICKASTEADFKISCTWEFPNKTKEVS